MSVHQVVVTGLGCVHAFGVGSGIEPLAAALAAGAPCWSSMAGFPPLPPHRLGARTVGRVPAAALGGLLPPLEARRMSPPSRFAVAAARMALDGAGLAIPEHPDPGMAVVMANAFGPMSYTQRLVDQMLDEGPEAASPALFTECVANAPAAQVSIRCRASGPNLTVCQREAGPLVALARGAAEVASGRARRALVGVVEEVTPLVYAVLGRLGAVAAGTARPFDRRRDGLVPAEGAAVLVLEEASAAAARGVVPLARVRAWGGAFDPTAGRAGWGRGGAALGGELRRLLSVAGVAPASIDRVVSGASGAVAGDRVEARTLAAAWDGAPLPALLAPKAVTGEYGGAWLAAAVLAAAGRPFGATPGFGEVDPELGVTPHDGSPLPAPRRLLASALASGGAAAWVILEDPMGDAP